ncbi:MAG: hypothetical protein FWB78_03630 [Treponema sp.]|nr:hypothetical protein [Treponema sp.]
MVIQVAETRSGNRMMISGQFQHLASRNSLESYKNDDISFRRGIVVETQAAAS